MEMLYGCPFEKIIFLSRIDTNSGFGRDWDTFWKKFNNGIFIALHNEGTYLATKIFKFHPRGQKCQFRNCQFGTLTPCLEFKIFWGQIPLFEVLWMCHYQIFSIICLCLFQIHLEMYFAQPSFCIFEWFVALLKRYFFASKIIRVYSHSEYLSWTLKVPLRTFYSLGCSKSLAIVSFLRKRRFI